MTDMVLNVPRQFRRGGKASDEDESVQSGLQLIQLMSRKLGLPDLGNCSVLDIGCGCKLVQAILDHQLPMGRYVGVDVYRELIQYLQRHVTDPRFTFHVQNSHNEMYNPQGEPLTEHSELPVDPASFDVICLFSVFTHLAPHDYVAMLKMLRRYVKPDGRLIFSLFVNETTSSGLGFIDSVHQSWLKNPGNVEAYKEKFQQGLSKAETADFVDFDPSLPLKWAIYSRENALRLLENTGWELESLNEPEEAIQHYMVCKPAPAVAHPAQAS